MKHRQLNERAAGWWGTMQSDEVWYVWVTHDGVLHVWAFAPGWHKL